MASSSGFLNLLCWDRDNGQGLIFRVHNAHVVKLGLLRANLTTWVPGSMIFTLMPAHPIWVAHSGNRVPHCGSSQHPQTSWIQPLSLEFPRRHDLVALGPTLHDELQHPTASFPHSKPSYKSVMQRLCAMAHRPLVANFSAESSTWPSGKPNFCLHWSIPRSTGLSHQKHSVFWRPGNDFCSGWYNLDLNSRKAIFSKPLIENSFSSGLKMLPTNFLFLEICTTTSLLFTT